LKGLAGGMQNATEFFFGFLKVSFFCFFFCFSRPKFPN
jgi:hypothetical protein